MIKISNPHYKSANDLAIDANALLVNGLMLADKSKKEFSLAEIRAAIPGISRRDVQQIAANLGAKIDNVFDVDL